MMSCFHKRQSKEMDSEKAATSAAGPLANRPERETTEDFFMRIRAQNLRRTRRKVTREAVGIHDNRDGCRYGRKRDACATLP